MGQAMTCECCGGDTLGRRVNSAGEAVAEDRPCENCCGTGAVQCFACGSWSATHLHAERPRCDACRELAASDICWCGNGVPVAMRDGVPACFDCCGVLPANTTIPAPPPAFEAAP